MKKFFKGKYFKMGLTALIVVILSILFRYYLYNGGIFQGTIRKFASILMPFIIGLVFAYLIWPIVKFFETQVFMRLYNKRNVKLDTKSDRKVKTVFRVLSIILAFIVVIALLTAFFFSVLPEIYRNIEQLIVAFPTYYGNFIDWADNILSKQTILVQNNVDDLFNSYSEEIGGFLRETLLPGAKSFVSMVYIGIFGLFNTILDVLIGLIIAVYLILSKEKFVGQCKKLIYSYISPEKANNLLVDLRFIDKTLGSFLVGKIIDSIIIGIICSICMSILKLPYVSLISLIIGVTNIIPFFGPFLGAVPSCILILLISPKQCIVFLVLVLVLQQLDGNVIGPAILGSSIGISSFWIIVAITIFGGLFGLLGMILGVPLMAVIYAFVRRNVNNRLTKKKLTVNTKEYVDLDYINDDNDMMKFSETKSIKSKRYIELNPNEQYAKNSLSIKAMINNVLMRIRNR